jgi:hypothetical protein
MSEKKSSGCVVASLVGILLVVAGTVLVGSLVGSLVFKTFRAGKEAVAAELAEHRAGAARTAEDGTLELSGDAMPEYASYQPGRPLTREMLVAWAVDERATTLAREAFREKAEGALVTLPLRARDVVAEGDRIRGGFYVPYRVKYDKHRSKSGAVELSCEFAPAVKDELLAIRRDEEVTIEGRLSLKGGQPALLDARLPGVKVEKE